MRLRFLGANGNVTGSKHFVETDNFRFLVDCGMTQGRDLLSIHSQAQALHHHHVAKGIAYYRRKPVAFGKDHHEGLKIPCPQGRVGSSPTRSTERN